MLDVHEILKLRINGCAVSSMEQLRNNSYISNRCEWF